MTLNRYWAPQDRSGRDLLSPSAGRCFIRKCWEQYNLFGSPNEAQIHIDEEGYLIKKVIPSRPVGEAAAERVTSAACCMMDFAGRSRSASEQRTKEPKAPTSLIFYESRYDAYTYVAVNGNRTRGRRRHDY